MSRDNRARTLKLAAEQKPERDTVEMRLALAEARISLLTKALAAKSYDLTLGFLLRGFESNLGGRTEREKRIIREKAVHGNAFLFTRGGEYRIIEAECQEDAWTKVRLMEGWDGNDVACYGETAQRSAA